MEEIMHVWGSANFFGRYETALKIKFILKKLKKGERHQGQAHTEKNHVRIQGEGGPLQTKERGLKETKGANTLILNF